MKTIQTQPPAVGTAFNAARVESVVHTLLAYQTAETVAGLVRARTARPIINAVRVLCPHGDRDIPLGPPAEPRGDPAWPGRQFELAMVPIGQPLVVEVETSHALQVDVLLPGQAQWIRLPGESPHRFDFLAETAGPIRVVARNATDPAGATHQTVPLRVIREVDTSGLRFPGFSPADLRRLAEAIDRAGPPETFQPWAYTTYLGQIEQQTRALLAGASTRLAGLHRAVAGQHYPTWPSNQAPGISDATSRGSGDTGADHGGHRGADSTGTGINATMPALRLPSWPRLVGPAPWPVNFPSADDCFARSTGREEPS